MEHLGNFVPHNTQNSAVPDADSQIEAMRAGTDFKFTVSLRNFSMKCRPLTLSETVSVTTQVRAELMKLPIENRDAFNENVMKAKATLEIASTSGPSRYDPQLSQAIMDKMYPDEIDHLYKQYIQVVERANPSLERMDRKELDSIVDVLKKSPEKELDALLMQLPFLHLVNVCRVLVLGS